MPSPRNRAYQQDEAGVDALSDDAIDELFAAIPHFETEIPTGPSPGQWAAISVAIMLGSVAVGVTTAIVAYRLLGGAAVVGAIALVFVVACVWLWTAERGN